MDIISEHSLTAMDAFMRAVEQASHFYGIGLTDGSTLFILEPGDEQRRYSVDDESRLSFA